MIPNAVPVPLKLTLVIVILKIFYLVKYILTYYIACRGNNRKNITFNCICQDGFFDNGG